MVVGVDSQVGNGTSRSCVCLCGAATAASVVTPVLARKQQSPAK